VSTHDGDAVVPAIRLEHVTKVYAGASAPAVAALDLVVPAGELVALVGPSGCGKTTILKMVNRLIEPTAGRILVHGVDTSTMALHELRRGIGYVIQQVGLFPHRTIGANIATVPTLLGWDKARTGARVEELCALVGLEPEVLGRYPKALSGGQQQRVGVARALAADPPVLLMDEPYSAVDPVVRARLQDELLDLQRRLRKTILLVTHDIDEAIKLADRVALLDVGGVLEQYGPPDEVLRVPASPFVERFLGKDRSLKRLSRAVVADLSDEVLKPVALSFAGPVLGPATTLRDALDALLGADGGQLPVADATGRVRGVITVDVISEHLR
jgi:osmoprotectant transport system ATP-binding protein